MAEKWTDGCSDIYPQRLFTMTKDTRREAFRPFFFCNYIGGGGQGESVLCKKNFLHNKINNNKHGHTKMKLTKKKKEIPHCGFQTREVVVVVIKRRRELKQTEDKYNRERERASDSYKGTCVQQQHTRSASIQGPKKWHHTFS